MALKGVPVTIDLKPEQQRVIDLAVRSGAYQDPGEVLDQAFEIIREQLDLEDWMFEQREALAAHIEKGFARRFDRRGMRAVHMVRQRRTELLKPQSRNSQLRNRLPACPIPAAIGAWRKRNESRRACREPRQCALTWRASALHGPHPPVGRWPMLKCQP